jgi:hypothetical protein
MAEITASTAQRIVDELLSANEEEEEEQILAMIIVDENQGDVLAAKHRDYFTKDFGVFTEGADYGGSLVLATLGVANELKDLAGQTQAIVTFFEKCKSMVVPFPSHQVVVGLMLKKSVDVEDYYNIISGKIEKSLLLLR